jgi:hypothetical protein
VRQAAEQGNQWRKPSVHIRVKAESARTHSPGLRIRALVLYWCINFAKLRLAASVWIDALIAHASILPNYGLQPPFGSMH